MNLSQQYKHQKKKLIENIMEQIIKFEQETGTKVMVVENSQDYGIFTVDNIITDIEMREE